MLKKSTFGVDKSVEWCACFVSWCYNQAGKSEPRFAGCQSQGVPWFKSRGQWGARGYENIAPGAAIFFDWDGDGSADHVGLVIGTDHIFIDTVLCRAELSNWDFAVLGANSTATQKQAKISLYRNKL